MRNRIARTQAQGTNLRLKVITGVSGSQSSSAGILDWSFTELNGAGSISSTYPINLPQSGSQTAVDLNIPMKFFGLTENASWLAQFAGQGFEDVAALVNLILLQEALMAEEYMLIGGISSASGIGAPTVVSATGRTSLGSGETAITTTSGNLYFAVSAKNFFGETTEATFTAVAAAASQVVDLIWDAVPGALEYNVYAGTGTADPGRTAKYHVATVGGTKYTVQGILPTSGSVAPSADSGTASANRYDGIQSVLQGLPATSAYPSGYMGGYVRNGVGNTLSYPVIEDALAGLWDNSGLYNSSTAVSGANQGFRASPTEIIASGYDVKNLSDDILKNQNNGAAYRLFVEQDQLQGITYGGAVSTVLNPINRASLNLTVHPLLPQGNAMLMSYTLPMTFSNVNLAWQVFNVQDYLSISWPVVDITFRYSIFLYGSLVGAAPQYSAWISGLQRSGATPYS